MGNFLLPNVPKVTFVNAEFKMLIIVVCIYNFISNIFPKIVKSAEHAHTKLADVSVYFSSKVTFSNDGDFLFHSC